MKKINNVKKIKIKANPVHYITGVVFIALIAITLYFVLSPKDERVLLENQTIEKTRIATGIVIKEESVIEKDLTKVLMPVISEGMKTKKGGVVARYRGSEYASYEETLAKLDKEILELMADLPAIYSSEIDAIDENIYKLIKESKEETSYAKMLEYKQRINSYINKRATIIGELSPDGAEIKSLISKRNKYEEELKKSNDNVLSPISGIISYKTDGLEKKLALKDIENIDYLEAKEIIENSNLIDNSNIKVVNNYEAYIITKVPLEDEEYINKDYNYTLRLIERNNYELKAKLTKVKKVEDGLEIYFKITNSIEELVDLREVELEIIWWQSSGLVIKNSALKKYENNDSYYLNVVRYPNIVEIPVKIKRQNDKYSVITNYTNDEKEELGINSKYKIKLHDRIIIKNEK